MSAYGTVASAQAQGQQAKAQKRAEGARQAAQDLDARRRRRKIIREQIQARAQSLATATAQGGATSSSVEGAFATSAGNAQTAISGVNQNQQLGNEVFAANQQYAQASGQAATGAAISQIGGNIYQNAGTIGRVGQYAFG